MTTRLVRGNSRNVKGRKIRVWASIEERDDGTLQFSITRVKEEAARFSTKGAIAFAIRYLRAHPLGISEIEVV